MKISKAPPKRNPLPVKPLLDSIVEWEASVVARKPVEVLDWNFAKADLYHFIRLFNHMDAFYRQIFHDHFIVVPKSEDAAESSAAAGNEKVPNDSVDSGKQKASPVSAEPGEKLDSSKRYRQVKNFAESDILLLDNFMKFTRLLFDNSTNRHLYASYEYLNAFLFSTSPRVVYASLKLLYKSTLRFQGMQRSLKNAFKTHLNQEQIHLLTLPKNQIAMLFDSPPNNVGEYYNVLGLIADNSDKHQLLSIKMLAIAIYNHLTMDTSNDVLMNDTTLVQSMTRRLFGTSNEEYPFVLKMDSLCLLESMFLNKTYQADVLSQLNLHSNTSNLLFVLSKSTHALNVLNLHTDYSERKQHSDFIDAILGFVGTIATSQSGSAALSGNGIYNVLLDLLKSNNARLISRAVSLVDGLIYSNPDFFTNVFVVSRVDSDEILTYLGTFLQSYSKRVKESFVSWENVLSKSKVYQQYYEMTAVMKSVMKLILHIMQSYPGNNRVRNLIETDLIQVVLDVMNNFALFQPQVHALAVNIVSIFIHNEPTCYAQLSEKNIPQITLNSVIAAHENASVDIIASMPNIIAAICLNPLGLEYVLEANPFKRIFTMFHSEKNLRALFDDDISSYLGPAFDELARHQPKLKLQIIEGAYDALVQILKLQKLESSPDVRRPPEMELMVNDSVDQEVKMMDKDAKVKMPEEIDCVLFFECIVRFFEGFFQHVPHCNSVLEKYPQFVEKLLEIYDSDFLGYDFASSAVSYSLSHIFRTMSDDQPQNILRVVFAKLREFLHVGNYFIKNPTKSSILLPYIDLSMERKPEAMKLFTSFKAIHSLIGLLCDVYSSPVFSNSKGFYSMIKTFAEDGQDVLVGLMDTYKWCAAESVYVRFGVPETWVAKKDPKQIDKKQRKICDPNDPRIRNFKAWKYLLSQTTAFIVPLFQGISKNMLPRRAENDQRPLAMNLAVLMMDSLNGLLTYERAPQIDIDNFSVSLKERFQFYHICSGLVHTFLTDERNTKSLLTVMAYAFYNTVLNVILQEIIPDLLETVLAVKNKSDLPDGTRTDLLDRGQRTLEGFFNILGFVVDHKPLVESSHTSFLLSEPVNKESNAKLPFELWESSDYLTRIRLVVMEHVANWIAMDDGVGKKFEDATIVRLGGPSLTSLIHIIMVILQGKGESEIKIERSARKKSKTESTSDQEIAGSRIGILQDMGFSEIQSRAALRNNGNSVMRAAEFLLSNPEYEPEESGENGMDIVSDDGNEDFEDIDDEEGMSVDESESDDSKQPAEEFTSKLRNIRQKTEDFFINNIFMLSKIGDIVFDIKDLIVSIIRKTQSHEKSILRDRLNLRQIFGELEMDFDESRVENLAPKFHLLALLIHENAISAIVRSELNDFLEVMISSLPKLLVDSLKKERRLLISMLLILEAVISASIVIQKDLSMKKFCSDHHLSVIVTTCVKILGDKTMVEDQSLRQVVYQILVRLSRNSEISKKIFEKNGYRSLYGPIDHLPLNSSEKVLSTLTLRHSLESDEILRLQVQKSLYFQFGIPDSKLLELSAVLKNNASLSLRNPPIFFDSCVKLLTMSKELSSHNGIVSINKQFDNNDPQDVFVSMEKCFSESEPARLLIATAVDTIVSSVDLNENHFAICSSLYLLCDVFSVYPAAKCVLLSLDIERFLKMVTSKLLPYGDLRQRDPSDNETKQQTNSSAWASQFFQILSNVNFVTTKEVDNKKKIDMESSMRVSCNVVCSKLILCLSESLQETFHDNSMARKTKLCVFQSISDLLSKLLTVPSAFARSEANTSANAVNFLAKTMLDNGLISILSKIAHSFESDAMEMKTVGKSAVKTLELLTKTANTVVEKVVIGPLKYKTLLDEIKESSPSGTTVQNEGFIKDSALGMFSHGNDTMETDSSGESDNDDEDDEMEGMSDEMDHGEPGDFTDMSDEDLSAEESDNAISEDEHDMDIVVRTVPMEDGEGNSGSDLTDDDNRMDESDMDSDHSDDPDEWVVEIHAHENDSGEDDSAEESDNDMVGEGAQMHLPDEFYADDPSADEDDDEQALQRVEEEFFDQQEDDEENEHDYDSESDEGEHPDFPGNLDASALPFGTMADFFAQTHQSPTRRIRRGNMPAVMRAGELFQDDQSMRPIYLNELIESPTMGWMGTSSTQRTNVLDDSNNPMLDRSSWTATRLSQTQLNTANQISVRDDENRNLTGHALEALEQIFNMNAQNVRMGIFRDGNIDRIGKSIKIGTEIEVMRPSDRWTQESITLFGTRYSEKCTVLDLNLIEALRPGLEEAQKQESLEKSKPIKEETFAETSLGEETESSASPVVAPSAESNSAAPETGGSNAAEDGSQTIAINGVSINLSNLGIDRTFLEALPDDLRAEVLAQHLREQGDLTMHTAFPDEINEDFLDALPAELREEIVHLREIESQEENHRRVGGNSTSAVSDFMALFEQNIQQVMRNVTANSRLSQALETTETRPEEKENEVDQQVYEPVELMNTDDLYVLMHMIISNEQARKAVPIFEVMFNLAENSKVRSEILETILYIIQEVIQMERMKQLSELPSSKGKHKLSSSGTMTPKRSQVRQAVMGEKLLLSEGSQTSVIQRCLELLLELLTRKEKVAMFFLTESETLHVKTFTRNKKNRSRPQSSRYPLVLLLSFLESPLFSKNTALMETLTQIISQVTKPLTSK